MNKQALAFLTLFSLILMLSVYYVTLPNDITAVITAVKRHSRKAQRQTIHHQLMRKAALQCRRQSRRI